MGWLRNLFKRNKPTPPKAAARPLSVTEQMIAAMLADGLSVTEIRAVYPDMDEAEFQRALRRVVKKLPTFFDG